MSLIFYMRIMGIIKRPVLILVFLASVFLAAVAFWYSPVLFKGNSAEPMNADQLVLARNYTQTGVIGSESELNVVLAPELVRLSAEPSTSGNRFTVYSYAAIFKLFGWQNWNNLVLISIIITALSLVFFTLAAYYVFGSGVALIFPFIFIFLPFNLQIAQGVATYEFALLYFSLFTAVYFFGRERKRAIVYGALAGLFLALACLSKEAFFIFLPILFFWQMWKRRFKELLAVFIPVGVILAIFWLPSMIGFGPGNDYSKLFVEKVQAENQYSDFWYYAHLFPDPYSYHFNHQQTIDKLNQDLASRDSNLVYKVDRLKLGKNLGLRSLNFFEWLAVGSFNLIAHVSKYFTIEFMGGPLIFLLMLLGFFELRKKDKDTYHLFLFWLISAPILISFVVLAIRNHLMDFGFAVSALVALGLIGLASAISGKYFFGKYAQTACFLLSVLVVYNLILADHVYLGRGYDNNTNLGLEYLADKVSAYNLPSNAVIAVGVRSAHPILNYLTGKSVVYFNPETVNFLVKENKLQDAFDKFGVKYIAGYDKELSDLIIKSSKVENLADWVDPGDLEIPVNDTNGWLLNLIK